MSGHDHYINGQWVTGNGPDITCADPATGNATWQDRAASPDDVDLAVAAARIATTTWADTSLEQRIELMRNFGKQLTEHKIEFAETISRDTGKPLWESLTEVSAMIGKIELSIKAYNERRGEVTLDVNGAHGATRFKPHGVCAVYGPFNLPGHLPNGHIVPALLAGNTIVFKPSEQAAAVGQHMMQLWHGAGLPTGVLNMVQGARETGIALSNHPGLDGLFFTGSSATGLALSKQFGNHPEKILAIETGGNNPLVVWDVADLDAAVYLTIQSAYITAGQRCTCARRLIVPQNHNGDAFIDRLAAAIPGIRVGRYTDQPEPFIGPLISAAATQKLLQAQQYLCRQGATSIVESTTVNNCPAMLSPGLLDVTDVTNRSDTELFGPLLQIIRVPDFNAALHEANNTCYGLSAALFSDRRDLYDRFYKTIRAGIVNWNRQTTGASGHYAVRRHRRQRQPPPQRLLRSRLLRLSRRFDRSRNSYHDPAQLTPGITPGITL